MEMDKNPTEIAYQIIKENLGIKSLIRARVGNVQNQNIRGSNLNQLIHDSRNTLLLNHRADSNPVLLLERGNGRRPLAGCDLGSGGKLRTGDVVLAQNEALGGNDTTDASSDQVQKLALGVTGLDEHGGALDDSVDGLEASGLHGLARF
jgi:hypothetical protein